MGAVVTVDLTEKEWAAQVADLARTLGWKRYHTFRSDRSPAGFPDETLVRDRIVFLELKTEAGKLSPAQKEWIGALERAGAEVYLWRPSDLEDAARILSRLEATQAEREREIRNAWRGLPGLELGPHPDEVTDTTVSPA